MSNVRETLDVLLRFGRLMLQAGDTAFRVRESMGALAGRLGIENLAAQIALNGIAASARRGDDLVTITCEIGPPGINAWRIAALERLARKDEAGLTARRLAEELDAIEAVPALRSIATVAVAIGLASGAFSYLNGGDMLGTVMAVVAGGLGQSLRALLLRHRGNQYAVTALVTVVTAGLYCIGIATLGASGFGPGHAAGFIFSVLFLVPGFPLVASLLDAVQHQPIAALSRLFYATMILLAAAIGLSAVAAIAGLAATVAPAAPPGLEPLTLALRALASLLAGFGFAALYNSSTRVVLAVGVLSLLGNELRLALHDLGMPLPPATFLGALLVGLLASLVEARLHEPRIAVTVPSIIIMTPGLFAFQTIVMLNQGQVLTALQAGANFCFVVGAMAMGLATARFMTERRWLAES
ncbi:threonine/serine exporter ThrE family protein [Reyranella sp.]|uniref:threonine/serine ThrE exporter family protein n=1 Tax=Reyranella sp. TaxID=1929291 RepID=UPI00272F2D1F|nr:threonine/serine exporter family protein [Reyranella sp.]MDP2376082.1 threonine/serine exporter family protein [Reyranella sp.]